MENEAGFLEKIKQESQVYLYNYETNWNETTEQEDVNNLEFNEPVNPALVENLDSNKKVTL